MFGVGATMAEAEGGGRGRCLLFFVFLFGPLFFFSGHVFFLLFFSGHVWEARCVCVAKFGSDVGSPSIFSRGPKMTDVMLVSCGDLRNATQPRRKTAVREGSSNGFSRVSSGCVEFLETPL